MGTYDPDEVFDEVQMNISEIKICVYLEVPSGCSFDKYKSRTVF